MVAPVVPILAGIGKGIVMNALPAIVQAIPRLGSLFATTEQAQRNVKALEVVAQTAADAMGATNAQQLVEGLQNPDQAAAARNAIDNNWARILDLSEAGGGGIAGARQFITQAGAMAPEVLGIVRVVTYWALAFLAMANAIAFTIYGLAVWLKPEQAAPTLQMLGSVLESDKGAALIAFGFWLGSSWGSKSKTPAPAQ